MVKYLVHIQRMEPHFIASSLGAHWEKEHLTTLQTVTFTARNLAALYQSDLNTKSCDSELYKISSVIQTD